MYVQDEVIYVDDHIRLEETDSNIYLRDGSQLIQNQDSKNSDIGELSVYQTPNVGPWEYNYWCSPVGVGTNSAVQGNVDFDISNLHSPISLTLNETNSILHPTIGELSPNPGEIATVWFFHGESLGGYADWRKFFDHGLSAFTIYVTDPTVTTGYGHTMKGRRTDDTNRVIDMRGRPNNGTISFNCIFTGTDTDPMSGLDNQVETLTGNPYPSAMDLKLFLANPTNQTVLDGGIYFWEQKNVGTHTLAVYEGGYAVYTPGVLTDMADNGSYAVATFTTYHADWGTDLITDEGNSPDYSANNQRRYAAIGQGFMVRSADNGGAAAGGTGVINNSMRLYLKEDSSSTGNGSVFRSSGSGTDDEVRETVTALSANGIDYEYLINNPYLVPEFRIHTKINDTYYRENILAFRPDTCLLYTSPSPRD